MALKIATLNVEGLQDPKKRKFVFHFLKSTNFDIFALQETHSSAADIGPWTEEWGGQAIWNSLDSTSKGTAILFSPAFEFEDVSHDADFDGRILRSTIKVHDTQIQILNIYGPNPKAHQASEAFYDYISQFVDPNTGPLILCGDFNMVTDLTHDRKGGNPRALHTAGSHSLQSFLSQHKLTDVWRSQHPRKQQYTWHCRYAPIGSRIDRIYLPSHWMPLAARSRIMPFSWSDHDLVVAEVEIPQSLPRGRGFWKLHPHLIQEEGYQLSFTEFWQLWQTKKPDFPDVGTWWEVGKYHIKQLSIMYSVQRRRQMTQQKQALERAYEREQALPAPDHERFQDLRNSLREIDEQQAKSIFVKAHMTEIEEGEKPTAYFFDFFRKRQVRTAIPKLTVKDDQGNVTQEFTDTPQIIAETTRFYKALYTREEGLHRDKQDALLANLHRKLPPRTREALDVPLTPAEIAAAVARSENNKSPGCDGLPYEFYKAFWPILCEDFYDLQAYLLNDAGVMTVSQRRAVINLLHKTGDKADLQNWRPISLLCTDYKIIAKALADKLLKVTATVLSEDQTCGVPGRAITSNLMVTRDIIEYTNQKAIPGYIITVDQEKAFDRVDRDFLFRVLETMNFGPNVLRWLKTIYTTPETSVLVNGHPSEFFVTTRGIRQGCPLSSILYSLLAETLGEAIRQNPDIEGLHLPGAQEQLKVSQYADDADFYISHRTKIDTVFAVLTDFQLATGSRIKPSKTKAMCLGGAAPNHDHHQNIQWRDDEGLEILGIHFFRDPLRTTNFNWTLRINQIEAYLAGIAGRDLSLKGKVLNLNSKALAPLWYLAAIIPFPRWEVKKVNKLLFTYLWGEAKQEPIRRQTIFSPREKGGLSLKEPLTQSLALRTRFFRDIGDPTNTTKWTYLARYWLGVTIAPLRPAWAFLRDNINHRPHPQLPLVAMPLYYRDCLQVVRDIDLTTDKWSTHNIYRALIDRVFVPPLAQEKWPGILPASGIQWDNLWREVHVSLARGKAQDVHFKFLHIVHRTNNIVCRFQGRTRIDPHCKFCKSHGRLRTETNFHCFFECPCARVIWRNIKPALTTILRGKRPHVVRIVLNDFDADDWRNPKLLATTVVQLAMQQIWLNRNDFVFRDKEPCFAASLQTMAKYFQRLLQAQLVKMKRGGRLPLFRRLYCEPAICALAQDECSVNLLINFITD